MTGELKLVDYNFLKKNMLEEELKYHSFFRK
jgi:hypothetical protein